MDWKHFAIAVVVLAVGFWLGKKYPNALAGVPVVGPLVS